jgi:hypothetical protein
MKDGAGRMDYRHFHPADCQRRSTRGRTVLSKKVHDERDTTLKTIRVVVNALVIELCNMSLSTVSRRELERTETLTRSTLVYPP